MSSIEENQAVAALIAKREKIAFVRGGAWTAGVIGALYLLLIFLSK